MTACHTATDHSGILTDQMYTVYVGGSLWFPGVCYGSHCDRQWHSYCSKNIGSVTGKAIISTIRNFVTNRDDWAPPVETVSRISWLLHRATSAPQRPVQGDSQASSLDVGSWPRLSVRPTAALFRLTVIPAAEAETSHGHVAALLHRWPSSAMTWVWCNGTWTWSWCSATSVPSMPVVAASRQPNHQHRHSHV